MIKGPGAAGSEHDLIQQRSWWSIYFTDEDGGLEVKGLAQVAQLVSSNKRIQPGCVCV